MSEPDRWSLSDGPPETDYGPSEDVEADGPDDGLPGPISRARRAAIAELLASVASADPESDPLADADERGGHALGCDPEAPNA